MILRGLGAWGTQIGSFAAGWAPFGLKCFKLFHLHTGEANSYYPRGSIMGKGNSPNFRIGWDRGDWVPGAFKLDHLESFKPLLFPNFYKFFTIILGGQFLLPQRVNNGKTAIIQLQNWMRQRSFSAWGIQTWPFAAHSVHFVMKLLHLFHFHTGRPILITQEGQ